MKKTALALCLLSIVLIGTDALACDLCAIYRGNEAKYNATGPYASVFEQFTHYGTVQVDGDKIPNEANQYMDSSITQFIAGYQATDWLGVQVNVPYIHRSYSRPVGFDIEHGTVSGIGDMTVAGTVRAYEYTGQNTIFSWNMMGGVKFPTGDSDRLKEELAEMEPVEGAPISGVHGHDLALGSGSYDGVIGASAFYAWKRLYATASLDYSIRSEGSVDYRYANDLGFSFKPGAYLYVTDEETLGLQLAVTGEIKGKDVFQGVSAPDTGINTVLLGPEVSFTYKEKLSAFVGAGFPVVNDNTSLQVVSDYRMQAAVMYRF